MDPGRLDEKELAEDGSLGTESSAEQSLAGQN